MIPMKPLIPLLLLAVLVLASAGCVQPQIPEPYPTPVPTVQPASAEESAFWISNTDQYLSYWNEKMGWNFTEQTLAGYSRDLNRYLDASWKYEAAGYYVTNNSEYLHAVKEILGLTVSSSMPSKGFSVSPKNSLLHSLPQTLHKRKLTK